MLPMPRRSGRGPSRIHAARVDDDWISLILSDGRVLRLPTAFSTPLFLASPAERRAWRINSTGRTIRWPSLGVAVGIKREVRREGAMGRRQRQPEE